MAIWNIITSEWAWICFTMWIHYWISSGRQIDNVTGKSSCIKLRIAVDGSPFANYYNSEGLQSFMGRSAWEQHGKPLNGLVVNVGGCCFVLPFADTRITILRETMNWRANAIEMDLSVLKFHAVFFTWKKTVITGTSFSFLRGLSWVKMDEWF